MEDALVIGADFGTDSVRTVVVNARDGSICSQAVAEYPRWKKGLYCKPERQIYRQHPLDYLESLQKAVSQALTEAGEDSARRVRGIAIDTTGSTPACTDAAGKPLALKVEFSEDPDAMFVLWKDHSSLAEAELINQKAADWKTKTGTDYLQFVGGIYSSEWFWAKAMHVFLSSPKVAQATKSMVEHCDWIAACLSDSEAPQSIKRSRCAAGHKGLWHQSFGGYPKEEFFETLDPRLPALARSLGTQTYTSDQVAGYLSKTWAGSLGLPLGIPVAVGAFDVHMGALGGGISEGQLVKVIGTSSCDVICAPLAANQKQEIVVPGVCGQVDGSIIPGQLAYEAGQSAFGDIYAWFKRLLSWPLENLSLVNASLSLKDREAIIDAIIPSLEAQALKLPLEEPVPLVLDWFNGRRSPDADQGLTGLISGLNLASDAPRIYRALIEATAFGSRAIVERLLTHGVAIDAVIAIGGIARKSPLVMQTLANVLGRPIKVAACDQACALGAAMFAATAAGLYPNVEAARDAMNQGFDLEFVPQAPAVAHYQKHYLAYTKLAQAIENNTRRTI